MGTEIREESMTVEKTTKNKVFGVLDSGEKIVVTLVEPGTPKAIAEVRENDKATILFNKGAHTHNARDGVKNRVEGVIFSGHSALNNKQANFSLRVA